MGQVRAGAAAPGGAMVGGEQHPILRTNEGSKCSANRAEQPDCECDSSLGLQREGNQRRARFSLRS